MQKHDIAPNTTPFQLDHLLNKEFPPNRWLIDKLIPLEGITILHGLPTAGKTWLMLEIALCVAQEKPLFDRFPVQQSGVLILDEESGEWLLHDRFKTLRAPAGLPIHYLTMSSSNFNENYVKELIKWCEDNEVKLIMIDSLVRIHGGDENTAKDSAKVFHLIRMFTSSGITILIVHHNTKASANGEYSSQMRGSGDIQASVDCQLSLVRPYRGDKLTLEQIKNRNAPELPVIELDFIKHDNYSEFVFLGMVKDGDKHSKLKPVILQIISDEPGINQRDIHEGLVNLGQSINSKTLRVVLEVMETKEGTIRKQRGKANSLRYFTQDEAQESGKKDVSI